MRIFFTPKGAFFHPIFLMRSCVCISEGVCAELWFFAALFPLYIIEIALYLFCAQKVRTTFYCPNLRAESICFRNLLTRLSTGFVGNLFASSKTITYAEIEFCGASTCALVNMKIYFFTFGMSRVIYCLLKIYLWSLFCLLLLYY